MHKINATYIYMYIQSYSGNLFCQNLYFLQTNFEELQPETVNAQVLKYAKTVYQLEKGLPPNGVVPRLKVKVEDMKDKVNFTVKLENIYSGTS